MKKLVVILALVASTSAFSASNQTAVVDYVQAHSSNGLTYFNLAGLKTNEAGDVNCGGSNIWIIKDPDSDIGKQLYSMILAAASANKTVTVKGSGLCPNGLQIDGEYVESIRYRN